MKLIQALDQRLETFDRIASRVNETVLRLQKERGAEDPLYILALSLQQLYGCIEDIAYRVSAEINGEAPTGPRSHAELLQRVCIAIPGKREPLFQAAYLEDLKELLKFRHFIRSNYGAELDRGKLLAVGECAERVMPQVQADLKRFRDKLASKHPPG